MNDNRPTGLLRLFQIFVILGSVPIAANTIDILLHPLAPPADGVPFLRPLYGLILAPLTIALGVLCVRRVPQNIIGWMLIGMGYGTSALGLRVDLVLEYNSLGIIASQFIAFFWITYLLIFLYFPTGRLFPERFNRYGNRLLAFVIPVLLLIPFLFAADITISGDRTIPNPFVIAEWDYTVVTFPFTFFLLISGLIALVVRYRHGTPEQRHQLRWLLLAILLQAVPTAVLIIEPINRYLNATILTGILASTLYAFGTPLAVGNAILRHRLYDIDIIIRRTLIYSVLTGVLALVYFGGVVVTQQLFQAVPGDTPDIAIVLSTLLIAALFNPLRRRIQSVIDRRLYRRKYDAEKTVEQFGEAMRDEVDPDRMTANLVRVIEETMQPEHVWLWLATERGTPGDGQ